MQRTTIEFNFDWNTNHFCAGIYFCFLHEGGNTAAHSTPQIKLILDCPFAVFIGHSRPCSIKILNTPTGTPKGYGHPKHGVVISTNAHVKAFNFPKFFSHFLPFR